MRSFFLFCSLLIALFFISCNSQKKVVYNYIEDANDTLVKNAVKNFEPLIQKNDLLSIQIYSNSTKPDISDALYNPPALNGTSGSQGGSGGSTGGSSNRGYMVDMDGNINFPRLGRIHVEGLTKRQLADTIVSKIADLENPTAVIRFLNYRITVLGEVGHQGTFTIPNERVTIFEALGLAGDIPVSGKKDNVKVLREVNGDREIGTVDLTSKNIFESPYYHLQQNDVILVEVKKNKVKQADQALVLGRIAFALSLVTTLAILYNIFK
ncbi:MAG TPA: polysaccharide biosynthesis/export family protein [Chitinophagaceae bacterium]|jgi:polysaccharide biosynthesis/export protein|nr:polysaccharide biosynthesis/export family protein [Chitinophagaceae bacterium]